MNTNKSIFGTLLNQLFCSVVLSVYESVDVVNVRRHRTPRIDIYATNCSANDKSLRCILSVDHFFKFLSHFILDANASIVAITIDVLHIRIENDRNENDQFVDIIVPIKERSQTILLKLISYCAIIFFLFSKVFDRFPPEEMENS